MCANLAARSGRSVRVLSAAGVSAWIRHDVLHTWCGPGWCLWRRWRRRCRVLDDPQARIRGGGFLLVKPPPRRTNSAARSDAAVGELVGFDWLEREQIAACGATPITYKGEILGAIVGFVRNTPAEEAVRGGGFSRTTSARRLPMRGRSRKSSAQGPVGAAECVISRRKSWKRAPTRSHRPKRGPAANHQPD